MQLSCDCQIMERRKISPHASCWFWFMDEVHAWRFILRSNGMCKFKPLFRATIKLDFWIVRRNSIISIFQPKQMCNRVFLALI